MSTDGDIDHLPAVNIGAWDGLPFRGAGALPPRR